MNKQTLGFNGIVVNKEDFHASKKAIPLNSINTNHIVISYRVKRSDDSYKYFIGYLHDDGVIRPLCVILPRLSDISSILNMVEKASFKIEEESVYLKYAEIWNKI